MATEITSPNFKEIIWKCENIKDGSPACYKLPTKINIIGTLTKVTLGEKNPTKKNKTILLVGETGTGKSTLINALVNYMMGVKFEDNVWFDIIKDVKSSQTESQTSDVIVYKIFDHIDLPYSLTIIDTPGYGSTKDVAQDAIVTQRLLDLFRSDDGVHEVDVVGLVVKASECRLSDRLVYIFNSVMSLFGNDMKNNIVSLITYSDAETPTNVFDALDVAKIKCAKNEKDQPLHFLFNNRQSKERTEDNENLKHIDKMTRRGMNQFINFLEKTAAQKLEKTVAVLKERIRLTACIQNLQDRIELIEEQQKAIEQNQIALKKHEQEMKKNEHFTIEVEEVYKDRETITGQMWGLFFFEGAVTCTMCKENCHFPGCTMAWYPEHCEVMKKGRCTVCTRKCLASAHEKEGKIYVTKKRKKQETLTDIKKKYEENKAGAEREKNLLENLEKEMKNLETDKEKWLEEAYAHVVKLDEIALNVHSLSTYVHYDFLIEKMQEKKDTEKVQKLKEMKCKVDETTLTGVRYTWERCRNFFTRNKSNTCGSDV